MARGQAEHFTDLPSVLVVGRRRHYRDMTNRVIHQTERRILREVKVPADEKVSSLIEQHTDIVQKGGGGKRSLSTSRFPPGIAPPGNVRSTVVPDRQPSVVWKARAR